MRVAAPAPDLEKKRARVLRRAATPAEARLWGALRNKGLVDARVKRQVPFGPWILDFAIPAAKLAIEVDGESHALGTGVQRDERRDASMCSHGWQVLRFSNRDVLHGLEGVLLTIAAALGRDPHPGPLPQAGEGG